MNTSKITITFNRDTNQHHFDVQGCSGKELLIAAEAIKNFITEKSGMSYDDIVDMTELSTMWADLEEEEEEAEARAAKATADAIKA